MMFTYRQLAHYPWLQPLWQQFLHTWRQKKANALLLSGRSGVGKNVLLRLMAQAFLCEQPSHAEPCSECRACQLHQATQHPDYLEIAPEPTKHIIIDQVRTITEYTIRKSTHGGVRVIAILSAEMLNENAANALLKILEEPLENCFFLLTTNAYYRLLPTIISRTQRIMVPSPTENDLHNWIMQQTTDMNDDVRAMTIDASHNSMQALRTFCTNMQYQRLTECFYSIGKMLAHKQAPLLPNALAQQIKQSPLLVIDIYLWIVAHLVRINMNITSNMLNSVSHKAQTQWHYLATSVHPATLFAYHDTLLKLRAEQLSGLNPNIELALNELLCQWRNAQQIA